MPCFKLLYIFAFWNFSDLYILNDLVIVVYGWLMVHWFITLLGQNSLVNNSNYWPCNYTNNMIQVTYNILVIHSPLHYRCSGENHCLDWTDENIWKSIIFDIYYINKLLQGNWLVFKKNNLIIIITLTIWSIKQLLSVVLI